MPGEITEKRLGEIEARAKAATPGPWDLLDSRVETHYFTSPADGPPRAGTMEWQILGGHGEGRSSDHGWAVLHGEAGRGVIHPRREDLLLAAHAGSDVPDLCAALREAWGQIAALTDQEGYQRGKADGRRECAEELRVHAEDRKGYDLALSRGLTQAAAMLENFFPLPPPLPHDALAAENARLREALRKIHAMEPEHPEFGISEAERMWEVARAALEGGPTP